MYVYNAVIYTMRPAGARAIVHSSPGTTKTVSRRRQAMATHQQVQQTTMFPGRVWAGVAKAVADLGYGLSRGLSILGTQRVGAVRAGTVMDTRVAPRPSDLFVQALRDDSNQEMDWLWLYT